LIPLPFGSRDGDISEKKKFLEFLPCTLHVVKTAFPLLWETPSVPKQLHPSCSNVQERTAVVMRLGNIKRPSKASIDLLGSGQFREKQHV